MRKMLADKLADGEKPFVRFRPLNGARHWHSGMVLKLTNKYCIVQPKGHRRTKDECLKDRSCWITFANIKLWKSRNPQETDMGDDLKVDPRRAHYVALIRDKTVKVWGGPYHRWLPLEELESLLSRKAKTLKGFYPNSTNANRSAGHLRSSQPKDAGNILVVSRTDLEKAINSRNRPETESTAIQPQQPQTQPQQPQPQQPQQPIPFPGFGGALNISVPKEVQEALVQIAKSQQEMVASQELLAAAQSELAKGQMALAMAINPQSVPS